MQILFQEVFISYLSAERSICSEVTVTETLVGILFLFLSLTMLVSYSMTVHDFQSHFQSLCSAPADIDIHFFRSASSNSRS